MAAKIYRVKLYDDENEHCLYPFRVSQKSSFSRMEKDRKPTRKLHRRKFVGFENKEEIVRRLL